MKKTLLGTLFLAISGSVTVKAETLSLDLDSITVSGLSSGGFMANQFHLAYSDWVSGAGLIAAGPYFCAQGDISVALAQCVNKSEPKISLAKLNATIEKYAAQNKIADLNHLKDSKVWIFHGALDTRVITPVTDALYAQYQTWVAAENIQYVNDMQAAHLFPTLDKGSDCKTSESPFIGNCQYDAAGKMLNHLYPDLHPAKAKPHGQLRSIDQQKLGGDPANSLAEEGFAYVPKSCQQGQSCKVHVSFHGCNQNAQSVGQQYALNTGLNRWADSNQMVILYPQTKTSMFLPLNPQGCWDWWGYTDEHYATRDSQQIQAVRNIIYNLSK